MKTSFLQPFSKLLQKGLAKGHPLREEWRGRLELASSGPGLLFGCAPGFVGSCFGSPAGTGETGLRCISWL